MCVYVYIGGSRIQPVAILPSTYPPFIHMAISMRLHTFYSKGLPLTSSYLGYIDTTPHISLANYVRCRRVDFVAQTATFCVVSASGRRHVLVCRPGCLSAVPNMQHVG